MEEELILKSFSGCGGEESAVAEMCVPENVLLFLSTHLLPPTYLSSAVAPFSVREFELSSAMV
jgi:hypothetical protein